MASSSAGPGTGQATSTAPGGNGNIDASNHASSSTGPSTKGPRNPQLGNEPWFAYPTPTPEQIEDELPPYFEGENAPLGPLLNRLVRKGYGDLRYLLAEVLPPLSAKQKPKHIINYATTTRQALLKYLAVLRWKAAVDVRSSSAAASSSSSVNHASNQINGPNGNFNNFPTPHSNGDDTSPASVSSNNKGKGKAIIGSGDNEDVLVKGKVTDSRRLAQFMEHQNRQHDDAVVHLQHVTKLVESLRERNPDLLTAIALLTTGTYNRLPTSITEPFIPKPPLTNSAILKLLKRLNRHIKYRLRCTEYIPPELVVEGIEDGQVYFTGGGENGWRIRMTIVGFGVESKWWLTGVEWRWRHREKGVDDPGGESDATKAGKIFTGEERQSILDLANLEILPPRDTIQEDIQAKEVSQGTGQKTQGDQVAIKDQVVDAPLVRIYNFIQHLSLSYQLEILFTQAMSLSVGKWRNQLRVEIDRETKTLKVKYWIRPRPAVIAQQQQAAVGKRPPPAASAGAARSPLVGGILSISLNEANVSQNEADSFIADIASGGLTPSERVLSLRLGLRWEVGELGAGGGLRVGDVMDGGVLQIDPASLDMETLILTSARAHAAHLTRVQASSLVSSPKFILSLLNQPTLQETEDPDSSCPLTLRIPLPSRLNVSSLLIGVSAYSGYVEIEDDGSIGNEARANRVELATKSINDGKTRLVDDIGRLTVAIVMENLEDQMRQLGWKPIRRLALRSQDLAKVQLHPATTILIPVLSSPAYYFVTKVTQSGLAFEMLKVIKVPSESGMGIGMKSAVDDRVPLDLERLRSREKGKEVEATLNTSPFEIGNKDLKNLFIYSNALVAQTIIENQLKERNIPFTAQYPSAIQSSSGASSTRSTSALAGMVPTICVDVRDLLRDGKRGAAVDVAMPKVGMQIENWWTGGRCEVTTIVRLQQQSSMAQTPTTSRDTSTNSSQAHSEDISFDPASSIVKFRAKDIERCVPAFLEQWERLSKVIVVAGEVNRLNKYAEFSDIKMLSFDLRTATLSYAKEYKASITYVPVDDSYQVLLSKTSAQSSSSPSISTTNLEDNNPHERLSSLLSARLTELASTPLLDVPKGAVGREFFGLLKNTLPFFQQVNPLKGRGWELIILDIRTYRIFKDYKGRRYALDVILIPALSHYLIQSSSKPKGPDRRPDIEITGPITELPLKQIVPQIFDALKPTIPSSSSAAPAHGIGIGIPPLIRLDRNQSLMCRVDMIESVLSELVDRVDDHIGIKRDQEGSA
uniref:Mediator of RNA polymerase II transcription subunit 14 n=1 Tax=Kwoniella dejecticola CBS 10117 TaxID=1296121 RepID=A0A1A6AF23_9TREE|nr:uncharacterized protein I303_00466 [Kwoniella dejecticola CBS 10117]OBR88649.1 hypothetical protein I303_00466 [Kwoniella dejecticola CBS 10117]